MKKLISLILLLCCVSALANVNVVFNLSDFQLNPTTNQTVWVQAMSVPTVSQSSIVIGPKLITNSGTGTFTVSCSPLLLYAITVKDPTYGTTIGGFQIFPTNTSGTISAYNCMVANNFATFPAGSVAWAAATSDLRYAPISVALSNQVFLSSNQTFTGTNIFTNNTFFSNTITLNGQTISNFSFNTNGGITALDRMTNAGQGLVIGTAGNDFNLSTNSTTNHVFNLPTASATVRGALASADWSTFNGKQDALGFTPVPNTRTVATTSPLTGGGALSGNLTLAIPAATGVANGYLSSNDFTTFSNKISSAFTINTTAPLTGGGAATNNVTIAIPAATSLQNGYLTSSDWSTFNAKQAALAATAPLNLTGSNLTITQAGTAGNGYVSSTDWNTFNGKQPSNVVLTGFAALGTNYYQATNANLTGFGQTTTNFFVQVTNGASTGQTLTNQVVKGTWTAATGASSGYVWTSDSGGAATWQAASSGGSGIPTLNGVGTNTTLTNALIKASTASNVFTVVRTNIAQSTTTALLVSNNTASTALINQASPSIELNGSAWDVDSLTSQGHSVFLYNAPLLGDGAVLTATFVVKDDNGQTLIKAGENVGITLDSGQGTGVFLGSADKLLIPQNSGTGNRVAYFNSAGVLLNPATTDMLPQGTTNLWYSNSLVQAFGDVRYQRKGIKTVTTTYSVTTNDYEIDADTTGGGFTITLPLASFSSNVYVLKNLFTNNLIVTTGGSDHIDNLASYTNNTLYKSDMLHSDGVSVYSRIAEFLPYNGNGIATLNGTGTNTTINTLTVNTNLTDTGNASISSNLTVTGSASFGTNVAQITSTGHYTSSYGSSGGSGNFVAGDENNSLAGGVDHSSILGGSQNTIGTNDDNNVILGGQNNTIIGTTFGGNPAFNILAGGLANTMDTNSSFSFIASGQSNYVNSLFSFAAGRNSRVGFSNSYVWNDSSTAFSNTAASQYLIHASGGVGINTNNPGTNALLVVGSITIPNGSGTFTGNGAGLTNLTANISNVFGVPSAATFPITEAPLYVRLATPSAPGTFSPQYPPYALQGEGLQVQYSSDGSNWFSLFPDGRMQFTNSVGLHDPSIPVLTNGQIIVFHTAQGNVLNSNTNLGVEVSTDWLNWGPLGAGTINVTPFANSIIWAPDLVTNVSGTNYLFYSYSTNSITQTRAVAQLDGTYTNWTAAASSYLVATNEAPLPANTGPLGGFVGINDMFPFTVTTNTVATNNASQGLVLSNSMVCMIAYNFRTVQYDLYTNLASNFPAQQLHLALTNLTSFPSGAEGGHFVKLQNGMFRFYGAQGFGTNGQFFYSDSPYIGGWTTYNFCTEVPRANFGQCTVLALYGTDKMNLQTAIGRAARMATPHFLDGVNVAYSLRQLTGYNGPAVTVRRSTDNAMLNIGFDQFTHLDTNTLLKFIGSGSAFVTTWFDQSGHGYNAINTNNDTTQPKLVNSGTLQVDGNGYPTIKWDGSTTFLKTFKNVTFKSGLTVYTWAGRNWNTAAYACVLESADYTGSTGFGFTDSAGTTTLDWTAKDMILASYGFSQQGSARVLGRGNSGFLNVTNNGTFYMIDGTAGTAQGDMSINAVTSVGKIVNAGSAEVSTNLFIGGNTVSSDYQDGNISEIIAFSGAPSFPQKQAIRGDISGYYGTPLVQWPNTTNNLLITGWVTANNGVASKATNAPVAITSTGITNNMGVNACAYVSGTAVSFTNFNNAGTAVLTNTALTAINQLFILQPGGSIVAASGLSGNLIPF